MSSKIPTCHSAVVKSTPSAIIKLYKMLLTKLKTNNFCQNDIFAIHLALEEAFINAVTHGNGANQDKTIKIEYSVDSDKIEISMTDEGEGFDSEVVPDPRYGNNLYKPNGRGLLLMRSYMDVVNFNARGNCVHMVKHKSRESVIS